MASTIKIKNSTTAGNAPSSLAQGELAINVADGKLFYGTVGGTNVSSSFLLTNITASGNISASGVSHTLGGKTFIGSETNADDTDSGTLLSVGGISGAEIKLYSKHTGTNRDVGFHMSASENGQEYSIGLARARNTFYISPAPVATGPEDAVFEIDAVGNITASGNISASKVITTEIEKGNANEGITIDGNITSSGHIKTTGTIYANVPDTNVDAAYYPIVATGQNAQLEIQNSLYVNPSTNITSIGTLAVTGDSTIGNSEDDKHVFTGNVTASNNISASGKIIGSKIGGSATGDQSGSLYLSGSLTLRDNEATPAVSASTLYNNNGHLHYAGGLLGGYHLSASADDVGLIKILSTGWINNDDSGTYTRLIYEDDSNVYGTKPGNTSHELYNAVDIPAGWTATKYMIYSNVDMPVDFIVVDMTDGTGTEDGASATANTECTLNTPYVSSPSTYALLKFDPNATSNIIYGGYIIIERR